MERFKIYPKPGLIIRDPLTMLVIPESGKLVYRTPFWIRRIKDGDVTAEQVLPVEVQENLEVEPTIQDEVEE